MNEDDIKIQIRGLENFAGGSEEYIDPFTLVMKMDILYPLVHRFLAGMLSPSKEATDEAVQTGKLMKVAVKGVLVMYGPKMLKLALGPDYPRPPKGCDIVEWYTDILAKIALSLASKNTFVVQMKAGTDEPYQEICEFSTVTAPTE